MRGRSLPVDFSWKRTPAFRVAAVRWTGPWSDRTIRAKFGEIVRWARAHRVATGRWIFREPAEKTWEVAIEVRGSARAPPPIRRMTYPAASVASIVFDPSVVSPEVVYHALSDWLRWRRREKKIRTIGEYREVYPGDPWRDPKAWARTDVQFVVRR